MSTKKTAAKKVVESTSVAAVAVKNVAKVVKVENDRLAELETSVSDLRAELSALKARFVHPAES